ncbi:SNF2-related protein [Proteiniborus sp.]|uniref:DEAD/DEAH box helicase n=1 Tax=Proteiniborus sp. TaxID=2079015 RepID=UPI003329E537
MKIFKGLKENITINKNYTKEGIEYGILYKKTKKITFPISKFKNIADEIINSSYFERINILEGLFYEDLITEVQGKYILYYTNLYELDEDVVTALELPRIQKTDIFVKSQNFLGHPQFRIDYDIKYSTEGELGKFYTRRGNIITFNKKEFLLSKEQYKLIDEIDSYIPLSDHIEQALFIAKVKKKSEKANATLDDYLKNETCFFPENIDFTLDKQSDDHIIINPMFTDIDNDLNNDISSVEQVKSVMSFADKNKRNRVFIAQEVLNTYEKLTNKKDIKGTNVPRFIDNPLAFLPENIKISDFSERVKGLKIRTYRARPFIHTKNKGEGGWFDFETGVTLIDNNNTQIDDDNQENYYNKGDNENPDINMGEFKELVDKARQNNEDYIYYNDSWIKIDREDSENFIKATDELEEKFKDKPINISDVPYILDIFDNIGTLEYDVTLVEIKKTLQDNKLLEYVKPKLLRAELYKYQQEGYTWLRFLGSSKLGGLLADDMGLGKTLQIIAFISYLKENDELKPSLIVLPSALIDNWKREIEKFTDNINSIYVHRGSNRYKAQNLIEQYDIVMTTYETLVRDQLLLGKMSWKLLTCDEAQKIKNATTLATGAVKALKCKYRLALTGTPVENGLNELWCIVDYVQPGLLKSYEWFRSNFEIPIQNNLNDGELVNKKREQLLQIISPIFLRRTKEDKLDNLPQKHELLSSVPLSILQEKLYGQIVDKIKNEGAGTKVLGYLQRLIQICSHPRLVMDDIGSTRDLLKESKKLKETLEILASIRRKGEKVIIFTKYRKMQSILIKVINDKFGIMPNVINGEVKGNRIDIINEFENKEGFNVLILSPRAAGVGLNIVSANNVIHYTREWNPAVENQATDRVYRIGQTRDVNVYYPICTSKKGTTVEERLHELLEDKKKLVKDVIIPSEKFQIKSDDFLTLFK